MPHNPRLKARSSNSPAANIACVLVIVLVVAVLALLYLKRKPHEAPADSDAAKLQLELKAQIQKLASPDEDVRKHAERFLADAGVLAEDALKSAEIEGNAAAKEALARLRNRRRFAGLKDLDYTQALPADSYLYVHAPNIQQAFEKAKQTAFGKLLMRPAFDTARNRLWERMQHDDAGELRQPPLDYFKGQFALAIFQTAPGNWEKNSKLGVLLEMKGADPQGEYLDWSDTLLKSGGALVEYKDIECLNGGAGKGAHVHTGNHILFGSDPDALHALIDTVLAGKGINVAGGLSGIRAALGKTPDLIALVDIPGIVNQVLRARAGDAPKPEDAVLEAVMEKIGYAGLSTQSLADGFEDRIVFMLPEGPGAVAAALTAPAESPPPFEALQVVPPDALAAAMGHIDGARLEESLTGLYNNARKIKGAEKWPDADASPFFAPLRLLEFALGLRKGQLLGLIKGEAGIWLELKPGQPLADATAAGLITAPDDKSAEEIAAVLDKLNASQPPGAFTKIGYNRRLLRSVIAPKIGAAERAVCWTADRNRVYFASSIAALKSQLDRLDRHLPGLSKREPLQKALAGFTTDERRGNLIYVDAETLLTRLGEVFIPAAMNDPKTEKDVKSALAELPPPVDLFRGFPPLVALTATLKDRGELIVRSPVPAIPITALALLFARDEQAKARSNEAAPKAR